MKTTTSKNPLCECDNCGFRALHDSLPPAKDIEERCADPRDEYSDVECPQCGALCFEVKPRPLSQHNMKHTTIYAFLLGLWEFRRNVTTSFPEGHLLDCYEHGRELAHKLTFRAFEQY